MIYERVFQDVLGRHVPTVLVDSACSSSHYCIDLAIKSLTANESDIAVCGGGFAAGIGNNCMFAQFNGLARNGIRPLDEAAEGTVFCDGAVVLLLRRLEDAICDGNIVHGVIRSIGLSSDGKSPAVNVPTSNGQQLAIERAYQRSGIDKNTIQYVEAHATATSGDVIEFMALSNAFTDRDGSLPKIRLGSNKALIGHTGWASGGSAVVKLLQAFKHKTIPAQYNLSVVNTKFEIEKSSFEVPKINLIWPKNVNGEPFRAAINGFGFGGTNAHIIVEAFDQTYHSKIISRKKPNHSTPDKCVVIGINSVFPASQGISSTPIADLRFVKEKLALPSSEKMILPDIKEHMSRAQFLSVIAADPLIKSAKDNSVSTDRFGIVLSFNDKCDRACAANLHIYKDRILRLIQGESPASNQLLELVQEWYQEFETEHLPAAAYTLAGIMPNVITGRVANLYDLKGPNFVISDNQNHGYAAIKIAQDLLLSGDADYMLCGIMGLERSPFTPQSYLTRTREGIVWLALSTKRFAQQNNLPVISEITARVRSVNKLKSYVQAV